MTKVLIIKQIPHSITTRKKRPAHQQGEYRYARYVPDLGKCLSSVLGLIRHK